VVLVFAEAAAAAAVRGVCSDDMFGEDFVLFTWVFGRERCSVVLGVFVGVFLVFVRTTGYGGRLENGGGRGRYVYIQVVLECRFYYHTING